ncbi:hypothetical protein HXX76_001281 [Chlamydomonas incerta]|uniref:Uncharacterized protein n=1 Tax=Chlamydomonas incerta TaxID=51695 RepID=A0A835WBU4_CHLIN|nr:hypothetical protein HXX76_001281 [Chlamydomonas incerta]|eukprot:KAG2444535.1 hypothetical protein HXX76_001281 [Chlamydomonas incerta]
MAACGQPGAVAEFIATDNGGPSLAPAVAPAGLDAAAVAGAAGSGAQPASSTAASMAAVTASTAAAPGWSAWELKPYMNENRNWQAVSDFFAALVRGDSRLSDLGLAEPHEFVLPPPEAAAAAGCAGGSGLGGEHGLAPTAPGAPAVPVGSAGVVAEAAEADAEEAAGRRTRRPPRQDFGPQRTTYRVDIAFQGSEFVGWAFQANRRTVQGTLEAALPALLTGPQYGQAHEVAAAAADGTEGAPRGRSGSGRGGGGGGGKAGPAAKVVVSSAGRTDAGVSAYGMPISFYAWHELSHAAIAATIAAAAPSPGCLRALAVRAVPRRFHATFSASWRRYVYLFPLRGPAAAGGSDGADRCAAGGGGGGGGGSGSSSDNVTAAPVASISKVDGSAVERQPQPPRPIPPEVWRLDPDVELVGVLLGALRGRALDYLACARDTPPGKDGICTLHVCRTSVVELPRRGPGASSAAPAASGAHGGAGAGGNGPPPGASVPGVAAAAGSGGVAEAAAAGTRASGAGADLGAAAGCGDGPGGGGGGEAAASVAGHGGQGAGDAVVRVLAVELVGSRFLKRMVRVLVSTALREATPGAARHGGRRDALLACFAEGREATGMPAPAAGLCFAGAGYSSEMLAGDED